MLKKRILASSMASVMALGSVSVVAFADEKKDYGEAVSRAELKEYIDSKASFIETELDTYGTTQADNFRAAIDHAKIVLDDTKADAKKDYTAAYQMIKAVEAKLTIYSAAELKALIAECKPIYEENNILNEEFQDNVYDEEDFADFTTAYSDAEFFVDSDDSRGITDAYVNLENAKKGLKELDTVTKAEFRTALKAYEQLEYKMKETEGWRRGKITVAPTTHSYSSDNKGHVDNLTGKPTVITMEGLIDMVYKTSATKYYYMDGETPKEVGLESNYWIGKGVADGSDLKAAITAQGKLFTETDGVVRTSSTGIVAAYDAMNDAVKVFNSWKSDSYTSGSKSACATLLTKYHSRLVEAYNSTDLEKIKADDFIEGVKFTHDEDKHTLKADKALYVKLEKGKIVAASGVGSIAPSDFATASDATKTSKIAAGTDIMKYLSWTDVDDSDAELAEAYKNYNTYLDYTFPASADDAKAIMDTLATGKTIAKCTGSTAEWTLIWRKLAYALEDRFPVAKQADTYSLAKLLTKIDEAYALAEQTGDSALFAAKYDILVNARQDANEFYKVARATTGYKAEDIIEVDGSNTTLETVYEDLKEAVDNLNKEYADYKYSYDEIRADIAKIANAADNGEVKASADLKKALAQCAYDLTVLVPSIEENVVFDSERIFQPYNRLRTNNKSVKAKLDNSEKALKKSYEALLDAYKKATSTESELVTDLDGDKVATTDDVTVLFNDVILKGVTDLKYDYNADKAVDLDDVTAYFNQYVLGIKA